MSRLTTVSSFSLPNPSAKHMPVLRSILSPQALIPLVEAAYGLRIVRFQLIKAAVLDTYWVLTGDERYIFRIYPSGRRSAGEINTELDFVQFLRSHGLPVSIPVAAQSGERVLTLVAPEGVRRAVLFTYAEGRPVDNDLDGVRLYGRALGRLHSAADAFVPAFDRSALDVAFLLERPLAHLDTFGQRQDDWSELRRMAETIRCHIQRLPRTAPIFGYCHGDFCKGNAHLSAEGKVTLFDFDFCGPGWRVYDVATFLSSEPAPLAAAFLEGYQAVRLLTDAERRAIPLMQIAQSIWMLGTRASYVNEWGNMRFADGFVDRVLHQIRSIFNGVVLDGP